MFADEQGQTVSLTPRDVKFIIPRKSDNVRYQDHDIKYFNEQVSTINIDENIKLAWEILQEEVQPDSASRNTKVYKEFIEESGKEVALLRTEKEAIEFLVDKMRGNLDFFEMI